MDLFRISHFRILQKLGSGGSADVFLAEDVTLHRKVALKVMHRAATQDGEKVLRFQQEAQWACVLNHPNVLTIFEIGEEGGSQYIVTEFVEGETLRQRMARPFTVEEALDVAIGVGRALRAAHEAWIVHRDIKPENVMLRADGLVKVLDFGVAKLTHELSADSMRVRTQPNMILGTIPYMSPEQLHGQPVDPRTDIYSLGVILYEMIGGRVPFDGPGWFETMKKVLESEPVPLAELAGDCPAELQSIVTRALQKDVAARYQRIGPMVEELEDLRQELLFRARSQRRQGE